MLKYTFVDCSDYTVIYAYSLGEAVGKASQILCTPFKLVTVC
jgi:hypothetical protein